MATNRIGHSSVRFNSNENRIGPEIFKYLVSGTVRSKFNYRTIWIQFDSILYYN